MNYQLVIKSQKGALEELVHTDRLFASELESHEFGLHFYESRGIILGKLDRSLKAFDQGLEFLEQLGYAVTIREQGGLGVLVDEGILNISLIMPSTLKPQSGLNEAYDTLCTLLKLALRGYTTEISFYEISNSYCPGKYDGVLKGKKFCGLAQKRLRDHVIVSATICVNQDQTHRTQIMKDFYTLANTDHNHRFPVIELDSMATLSQLLAVDLSIDSVKKQVSEEINKWVDSL